MLRKRIVHAYLSSVISISLVLLLTGIAALLVLNAHGVTKYLKENMRISVLLRDDATEGQACEWAAAQEALPYVRSTRVITRSTYCSSQSSASSTSGPYFRQTRPHAA